MINKRLLCQFLWASGGAIITLVSILPVKKLHAEVKIRPDATLKGERSLVKPINGRQERVDGGATRGRNLFHSFQEFNVGRGRGVFFSNPTGVENILSRVTGNNPSNILGELGVLGQANLWLLNPNGVVFGPNARVQVAGSFFTSTADAIELGKNGLFSAAEPGQSQLLSVSPGASFFEQAANRSGSIIHRGNVTVGEQQSVVMVGDLLLQTGSITAPSGSVMLLGNQVSLERQASIDVSGTTLGGSVVVGGDITGGAEVTAARTFVGPDVEIDASALTQGNGGRVIVGADEVVGFYGQVNARGGSDSGDGGFVEVSGKEHVLFRGEVNTDAVNGKTGVLVLDPVNITIADGSGDGAGDGTNTFTGDESGLAGSVLSQPLSEFDDGSPVTIFESELEGLAGTTNVSLQATNDIRVEDLTDDQLTFAAGNGSIEFVADADVDGAGAFVMLDLALDTIATNGRDLTISGASLSLGNIDTSGGANGGGDIVLEAIDDIDSASIKSTGSSGRGGDIIFSSAFGDITTNGVVNSASFSSVGESGQGGNITFSSTSGDISTNEKVESFSFTLAGNSGRGGDITFSSTSGDITTDRVDSFSASSVGESGQGGNITFLSTSGDITTNGQPEFPAVDSGSRATNGNSGQGGDITFSSTSGDITINQHVRSSSFTPDGNSGRGGDITFSSTSGAITTDRVDSFSASSVGESGQGGNISFLSTSGDITTNGQPDFPAVDSGSRATNGNSGQGGDISFSSTSGDITTNGQPDFPAVDSSSRATNGNSGQGGDITFSSTSGDISTNEAVLSLSSSSAGNSGRGGDITFSSTFGNISTDQQVRSASFSSDGNSGQGGDISFLSTSGTITTNEQVSSFSFTPDGNSGRGGNITFSSTSGDITTNLQVDSFSFTFAGNSGRGGDITFSSTSGDITTNLQVDSGSRADEGKSDRGGNISISSTSSGNIWVKDNLRGVSFSIDGDAGTGGNIELSTNGGFIRGDNTPLSVFSVAENGGVSGAGGRVTLTSDDISGLEILTLSSSENSGDVKIQGSKDNLRIRNTLLTTSGQIEIPSPFAELGETIFINVTDFGPSGKTEIIGTGEILLDNFQIQSDSNGSNDAGDVIITSPGQIRFRNSQINSNTNNSGNAGDIRIKSEEGISIMGETDEDHGIFASSEASGDAGNITIDAPSFFTLGNNTQLVVETSDTGLAGNITVTTDQLTIGTDAQLSATANQTATINQTATNPEGKGNININALNLNISGELGVFAETQGQSPAGTLTLRPNSDNPNLNIVFTNNGIISASTTAEGPGGDINLSAPQAINIRGAGQVAVTSSGSGDAGDINIESQALNLSEGVEITASTTSAEASGGNIDVTTQQIRLNDSDITTDVRGAGEGGDILLTATNSILAFGDSDILAFSAGGRGGNINLNTPIFLGESFTFTPNLDDFSNLDGNGRVDINASGEVSSGTITTPDNSTIEESLTELPDNLIDTNDLLANSCIVRTDKPLGKFVITGSDSLRARPGYPDPPSVPTGTVQTIPSQKTKAQGQGNRPWQIGDPIIEPESVYRLPDGQLIISHECAD